MQSVRNSMEVLGDTKSMHRSAAQAGKNEQIQRSYDLYAGLLWPSHRYLR